MKNINWKVRFQSKEFLSSLIALLLVLANQIAHIFGVDITIISQEITNVLETVLTILGLMGVIHDPTTKGFSDSEQAMNYDSPRKDGEDF